MQSPKWPILALMCGGALIASESTAQDTGGNFSIDFGVSTFGIGITPAFRISPTLGVRAPIGYMTAQRDFDSDEIKMNGKAYTGGIGLLLDYYPSQNGFRFSGGLMAPFYRVEGTSDGASTEIDGVLYAVSELRAEATTANPAPYVGIGYQFKNRAQKGWGASIDLGALIGVRYQTNYSYQPINLTDAQKLQFETSVENALAEAERQLNNEAGILPYVSISVSFRF